MECPRCKDGTILILEASGMLAGRDCKYSMRCRKCNLHEFIEIHHEVCALEAIDYLKEIIETKHYPKLIPADYKLKRRKQYTVVGPRVGQRKRHYSRFLEKSIKGESNEII